MGSHTFTATHVETPCRKLRRLWRPAALPSPSRDGGRQNCAGATKLAPGSAAVSRTLHAGQLRRICSDVGRTNVFFRILVGTSAAYIFRRALLGRYFLPSSVSDKSQRHADGIGRRGWWSRHACDVFACRRAEPSWLFIENSGDITAACCRSRR